MSYKPNILVVDDEKGIRDTLFYALSDLGYNVSTAANSKEALSKLKNKKFRAILSDIVMEDGDGIMLLKELKKLHSIIPIILFTGYASMESSIAAVNFNAYAYLKKPVSVDELNLILSKAINEYKEIEKKDKIWKSFIKNLFIKKEEHKQNLKKDGIIENDIQIPADINNFSSIEKGLSTFSPYLKAKVVLITKDSVIKKNLTNLFNFIKLKNFVVLNKFVLDKLSDANIITGVCTCFHQ
jgi:CheY-like chemotaxis protein